MADPPCTHPIQAGGMCAYCGEVLSDAQQSKAIPMVHDTNALTVSHEEAQRLDNETTRHLIEQRKLALIVDLDQTIIHATVDPTVGEWLKDPSNPNYGALKGVGSFRLGLDGKAILEDGNGSGSNGAAASDQEGCWYYVKPRPGLSAFLKSLCERYELHVYTMGTRSYADCVCKLVDPDGSIFGSRILSRDENGSLVQKSLTRLFPVDTSMVVIIDDRGDVWGWSPNLVKVIPYDFFIGSGDINATFLPALAPTPESPASSSGSVSAESSEEVGPSSSTTTPSLSPSLPQTEPTTEQLNDTAEKEVERAADDAAKAKAEQSQKTAVSEQLGARPLARMQEQLDEKLGLVSRSSTEERTLADPSASTSASVPATDQSKTTTSAVTPAAPPILTQAQPQPPTIAKPQPVLRDNDTELQRVQKILDNIHRDWYQQYDSGSAAGSSSKPVKGGTSAGAAQGKPNVTDIIGTLKKEVLKNCDIVFSSLIPLGGNLEDSDYFWLACEYGATCSEKIRAETTHIVAAKPGTAKVNQAHSKPGKFVVWPCWLHDSIARWQKQRETAYLIPPSARGADPLPSAHPTDDELSSDDLDHLSADEDLEDDAAAITHDVQVDGAGPAGWGFEGMNWAAADEELKEFMDGSDDEEDDDEEEEEEEADAASEASLQRTPSKKAKRSRMSTPSTNGEPSPSRSQRPSNASDAAATGPIASSSSSTGKRRKVIEGVEGLEAASTSSNEFTSTLKAPPMRSRTRSNASVTSLASRGGGGSVAGDDADDNDNDAASFADLEDELEAALAASAPPSGGPNSSSNSVDGAAAGTTGAATGTGTGSGTGSASRASSVGVGVEAGA